MICHCGDPHRRDDCVMKKRFVISLSLFSTSHHDCLPSTHSYTKEIVHDTTPHSLTVLVALEARRMATSFRYASPAKPTITAAKAVSHQQKASAQLPPNSATSLTKRNDGTTRAANVNAEAADDDGRADISDDGTFVEDQGFGGGGGGDGAVGATDVAGATTKPKTDPFSPTSTFSPPPAPVKSRGLHVSVRDADADADARQDPSLESIQESKEEHPRGADTVKTAVPMRRPSSSAGSHSTANRVLFAPTVRIGSRRVRPDANHHHDAQSPVALPAAVDSSPHRLRRPQTAPDSARRWPSLRRFERRQQPPVNAAQFPDGFISAPLHPDGPFGGDADADAAANARDDARRLLRPALPEDLPPPPRFFVPGTLILVRDESLWRRGQIDDNDDGKGKEPAEPGPDALNDAAVDAGTRADPRPTLQRRHTLPADAALPSQAFTPAATSLAPGDDGNANADAAVADHPVVSDSLRLLDSRLDEVVSRRGRRPSLDEEEEDAEEQQQHVEDAKPTHSHSRSHTHHGTPRRTATMPAPPVVLWHGQAPTEEPPLPRAQKRKIPLRAVAVAARAMKRFFDHGSSSGHRHGKSADVDANADANNASAAPRGHRRSQSAFDEIWHGKRAARHRNEEDEAEEEEEDEKQRVLIAATVAGVERRVRSEGDVMDDGHTQSKLPSPLAPHDDVDDDSETVVASNERRASEPFSTTPAIDDSLTSQRCASEPHSPRAASSTSTTIPVRIVTSSSTPPTAATRRRDTSLTLTPSTAGSSSSSQRVSLKRSSASHHHQQRHASAAAPQSAPPLPPSILLTTPADISTRATPWEFGSPCSLVSRSPVATDLLGLAAPHSASTAPAPAPTPPSLSPASPAPPPPPPPAPIDAFVGPEDDPDKITILPD